MFCKLTLTNSVNVALCAYDISMINLTMIYYQTYVKNIKQETTTWNTNDDILIYS